MSWWAYLLIFLAGFLDSIVGGGGLITIPTLSLFMGVGVHAIATNKILGTVAALVALVVYARKGHLNFKLALRFLPGVLIGTVLGSLTGPHLPAFTYKYILFFVSPLLLVVILKRERLIFELKKNHQNSAELIEGIAQVPVAKKARLLTLGFVCGFYDGVFGPGGGTFMFLSLAIIGGLPMLQSLAASKVANTASAGTSLVTYHFQKLVSWELGLIAAIFIGAGAYLGARAASQNIKKILAPLLITIFLLLLFRLLQEL